MTKTMIEIKIEIKDGDVKVERVYKVDPRDIKERRGLSKNVAAFITEALLKEITNEAEK